MNFNSHDLWLCGELSLAALGGHPANSDDGDGYPAVPSGQWFFRPAQEAVLQSVGLNPTTKSHFHYLTTHGDESPLKDHRRITERSSNGHEEHGKRVECGTKWRETAGNWTDYEGTRAISAIGGGVNLE
jgi:hypothetical protein